LLAAVGAGAFADLRSATQRTLARAPLTPPDPEAHRAYQRTYDRFRACSAAAVPPRS